MTLQIPKVILLLIGFIVLPTEGVSITADFATAQDGTISPASHSANVGDSIVWNGHMHTSDRHQRVYVHPSGNCSQLDRVEIQRSVDGLAMYTFTNTDAGKSMFFASDELSECEAGQHMTVQVRLQQTESRRLQTPTDTLAPSPTTMAFLNQNAITEMPTKQPVSATLNPTPLFIPPRTPAPTVVTMNFVTLPINPIPTPTLQPTNIPTFKPTSLAIPPPTPQLTPLRIPNPTFVPTSIPTILPIPSPTPQPTFPPTSAPTVVTPKPTQKSKPTSSPTASPTPLPTMKPSPTPKPNPIPPPTPAPVAPPTPRPTRRPTPMPTPGPTAEPTESPVAFALVTRKPEPTPTAEPTPSPTKRPDTKSPTDPPTAAPSAEPTKEPSPSPTDEPSPSPTDEPTSEPTSTPTLKPSTSTPTFAPSMSMRPSLAPSKRPVWMLPLPSVETPTSATQPSPAPTSSSTVRVTGTIDFTVLVAAGNRDQIAFDSYSSQLIDAVDALALEVAGNIDTSSQNGQNGQRNLMDSESHYLEGKIRLLQQQLDVDSPASITTVQRVGFTSDPELSDSNVFLGGACPATIGSDGDRCEAITASIDLLVAQQYNVQQIQKAFQQGLEKGVTSGRLQHFLNAKYPQSTLTIVSGQKLASSNPEPISSSTTTQSASDPTVTTEVAPGAISGIVLAVASGGLLTVLALLLTRRRQNIDKATWKENSIDVTAERASMDGKTLPEAEVTGLEWGPPRDIHYNEDIDDWSAPSMAGGQPTIVILGTENHDIEYPQPLDDNFSILSADELKDTPSRAGSVTSGTHPGDRSVVSEKTGHASSLGSVSSTGFMSGNQVVDMQDGTLRDYIPNIADFDDLEAAILAGDWAAVGATAAALASTHDGSVSERNTLATPSWDEESRDLSTRSKTWQDVIDANKAAELDNLIEQGNWAAIIEVAAKYEWETKESSDMEHGDV